MAGQLKRENRIYVNISSHKELVMFSFEHTILDSVSDIFVYGKCC